jgi:hypothetical protein
VYEALSNKYYAPYFLLLLIERDTYRKLNKYDNFIKTIDAVTLHDLENLSKNSQNEELFMNFLRYITLLDKDDEKRING